MSIKSLLASHRNEVLPVASSQEMTTRITVRRRHVWQDALHKLRNGLDATKPLRVTFIGEPAVDTGGPLREFFRLAMGEIFANNSIFHGSASARIPAHNVVHLRKKTYFYVGKMFAISLVHGGPAPACMASPVADYFTYGMERVKATVSDVPDMEIQTKLQQVWLIRV